ncbi:B12-binding domain-containing radical SAM protein [bacterium]|nr:B12-binding domain-containing radical SAM protein [candidate division CSSED10-310 bacterium]
MQKSTHRSDGTHDGKRVLLVVPPALKSRSEVPDLGLGYVATALRRKGFEVAVYQAEMDPDSSNTCRYAARFQPHIIGIKLFSFELASARDVYLNLRETIPEAVFVAGGPHASLAEPDHCMSYLPGLEFTIQGEGEISMPLLAEKILRDGGIPWTDIPGLIRRTGSGIRVNPPYRHDNLDDFDFPAWDLIDPRDHARLWFWSRGYPGAPLLATRGCSFHCAFCNQNFVNGKKVRRRSVGSVLAEMQLLQDEYGVHNFDFVDDNFLSHPAYVEQLMTGIIDKGWDIHWNSMGARVDCLDRKLVRLMERAGADTISIGMESGSPRIFASMNKGIKIDRLKDQVYTIAKNSTIRVLGMFILGYPTETADDIGQTIRYATRLPLSLAHFFTYLLIPGCDATDYLLQAGEISDVSWENLGMDVHQYVPRGLTRKQLKRLYYWAYIRFFTPRAFRLLWQSRERMPYFFKYAFRKFIWRY